RRHILCTIASFFPRSRCANRPRERRRSNLSSKLTCRTTSSRLLAPTAVLPEPELGLRHLIGVVDVESAFVLDRIDLLAHPFLRQQTFLEVIQIFRAHDRYTHVGKPRIPLAVAITI